ncbi:MAG TPA: J domain-containing protein [Candidatus Limnocylindrales bacterium]|nr:J domain-containing protein [Candidatus Limnocylindrales bacterium]
MEYKDYYAILGVPRTASAAEIKKAYRKLARQYHPDVNKGDAAAEKRFKEVNEAHAVLGDAEKRKAYDTLGANWEAYQQAGAAGARGPFRPGTGFGGFGPGNVRFEYHGNAEDLAGFSDFFRTFFAGGGAPGPSRSSTRRGPGLGFDDILSGLGLDEQGGRAGPGATSRRRQAPAARNDVQAEAEISLEEAYHGTSRIVQLDGRRLEVTIPRGVETGQRIRLSGTASRGSTPGDIYVRVTVREHPVFRRRGVDLQRELPLTLEEALLGAEVPVETLKGRVLLRVPPETQDGRTFRLVGQGMPRFRAEGHGDLYVKARVVLPSGLDAEAVRRFRHFAAHVRQPDPRSGRASGARAGVA